MKKLLLFSIATCAFSMQMNAMNEKDCFESIVGKFNEKNKNKIEIHLPFGINKDNEVCYDKNNIRTFFIEGTLKSMQILFNAGFSLRTITDKVLDCEVITDVCELEKDKIETAIKFFNNAKNEKEFKNALASKELSFDDKKIENPHIRIEIPEGWRSQKNSKVLSIPYNNSYIIALTRAGFALSTIDSSAFRMHLNTVLPKDRDVIIGKLNENISSNNMLIEVFGGTIEKDKDSIKFKNKNNNNKKNKK